MTLRLSSGLLTVIGYLLFVIGITSCGSVITKETRIREVTDTVNVPGKSLELVMPSDSVVFDSDAPPSIVRYKTYEERLQEAREASRRAADEADKVLSGEVDNTPHAPLQRGIIKGFTAVVETTTQGVRMRLKYKYPADLWSVSILERDTFVTKNRMDTSKTTIVDRPVPYVPFWCYLTMIVIGGLLVLVGIPKLKSLVGL